MPTVMMMTILGMRSRDLLLRSPCTALPSQAKGRGASGDLAEAPQQKPITGGGETNTAPADSPCGSQFAPSYGPLNEEKVILRRMSEFLHSLPFHHCIDFPPLNPNPCLTSSLQSVHSKTLLVCFQILELNSLSSRCLMCLKLGTHWEFTSAAYAGWQEKMETTPQNPTGQTSKFLPRFSCSIYISVCTFVQPHVGEFCFFPVLKSGYGGHQGLCAKTDEMCS